MTHSPPRLSRPCQPAPPFPILDLSAALLVHHIHHMIDRNHWKRWRHVLRLALRLGDCDQSVTDVTLKHFQTLFSLESTRSTVDGVYVEAAFHHVRDVIVDFGRSDGRCFSQHHDAYFHALWTFVAGLLLNNIHHTNDATVVIQARQSFGLTNNNYGVRQLVAALQALSSQGRRGTGCQLEFDTLYPDAFQDDVLNHASNISDLLVTVSPLSLKCLTIPFLWMAMALHHTHEKPDSAARALRISFTDPRFPASVWNAVRHDWDASFRQLLDVKNDRIILEMHAIPGVDLPWNLGLPRDNAASTREMMIDVVVPMKTILLVGLLCSAPQRHIIVRFVPGLRSIPDRYYLDVAADINFLLRYVRMHDPGKNITFVIRLSTTNTPAMSDAFLIGFLGTILGSLYFYIGDKPTLLLHKRPRCVCEPAHVQDAGRQIDTGTAERFIPPVTS